MFYVLLLRGRDGFEPELSARASSEEERDALARRVWAGADPDSDLIYRINTGIDGGVVVEPYGNFELARAPI